MFNTCNQFKKSPVQILATMSYWLSIEALGSNDRTPHNEGLS
jgi:hypothetical protein